MDVARRDTGVELLDGRRLQDVERLPLGDAAVRIDEPDLVHAASLG